MYPISTEIINWRHPEILSKAESLASGKSSHAGIAKSCFEWVRDHVRHIDDHNISSVSFTASEV